ncbi:hypothetical protein BBI01_01460 [Chryseobacterium artocarpi]|uniref:Helix-turn-helix domain-containing protein n=1 Tax=Chryseobacterium artocarpi TaxID=1414727 RepID=A0A1B8ZZX6_9FLAO|nr:helix-turn-helix domain-containing protein [Chryseobacterium artocarpi]OCA77158.1 hypothetical protein BBI01_01460 [Chryseobacterium artocarpi]
MKNYTFEQLPSALAKLEEKVDKILELLNGKRAADSLEDDYIGAKEACAILKLSLPTLYSKVCHREIPSYKRGNRLHFSRSELRQWIKDGKKKTMTEISLNARDIANKMEKRKW